VQNALHKERIVPIKCSACEGDPFTARLLELLQLVDSEGIRQPLSFGVLRSDYMIDEGPEAAAPSEPALRQIELNTISCSFPALSSKLALCHRSIVSRYGAVDAGLAAHLRDASHASAPAADLSAVDPFAAALRIPENPALSTIAAGMARAHAAYGAPT
jgi:glutathione synthase